LIYPKSRSAHGTAFLLNKNTNGVKSGIANVGELYENFLLFAGKKLGDCGFRRPPRQES
jgi:hypothetical protein